MKELKIISRAVIVHNDKILLVKNHNRDFWSLPGGHWEHDHESLGECAIRETEEETGYLIEVKDVIFCQELRKPYKTVVEIFWSASLSAKNSREQHAIDQHIDIDDTSEIAEVAWFTKDEIRKVRVVPESIGQYFTGEEQTNTFIGTFELNR